MWIAGRAGQFRLRPSDVTARSFVASTYMGGEEVAMASRAAIEPPELLTSWKEIANYLGKGVRTVQRWEQQYGLPVRRPNEKAKGIVHATRRELDRWLEQQWSRRASGNTTSLLINDHLEAVRSNIQYHAELQHANRALLQGIQSTVSVIHKECQVLSSSLSDRLKAN